MSRTLSPSFARGYGLARVAHVWKVSPASVYRSRKQTPPTTNARRPGPVGACSDAELADHIRRHNLPRYHKADNAALACR
jgi:putative transposase